MTPTPDLCDAHPDHVRVLAGLAWRHYGGKTSFGGEVETVRCFEDNSRVKERLAEVGHGKVLVVDGGGSLRHALIGDMIAARAAENGWQGVVIHGACRDVDVLNDIDFGVCTIGVVPIKSVRRGEGQLNEEIMIAGVVIRPGDFIYADANGVILADRDLGAA